VRPSKLGVIGLGAIGGSLALQAKRAGVATVLGCRPSRRAGGRGAPGRARRRAGAGGGRGARGRAARAGGATGRHLELLGSLKPHIGAGALITMSGRLKRAIVAKADALGSGPLRRRPPPAGTHAHGFAAARVDLFKGATVYITATRDGDGAAREVSHFWESVLDAHPVRIDAAQHDRQLALTSHLPQAMASLLANVFALPRPRRDVRARARDTTASPRASRGSGPRSCS